MDTEVPPSVRQRLSPPQPPPQRQSSAKTVRWLVIAGLVIFGAYGWNAGWFEMAPTTCSNISVRQMNRVYENSLPGKMGLRILGMESIVDRGSNSKGLRCEAKTLTNRGDMTFTITTREMNGQVYIEMVPSLF